MRARIKVMLNNTGYKVYISKAAHAPVIIKALIIASEPDLVSLTATAVVPTFPRIPRSVPVPAW